MATLASGQLTIYDYAKRLDPDGQIAAVAELLTQANEILEDMVVLEGNLPTGHRVTVRTGLPSVFYRQINAGVAISKSTTAQIDEALSFIEGRSHIDIKLAKLNGNTAKFRAGEAYAFIEAMNQLQVNTLFYGNHAVDAKQYPGFAVRYGAISGAGNAQNIIDGGGVVSNNTSIWLVGWGENSIFNFFPKGSQAGLQHRDLGEEAVTDANGNWYQAFRDLFEWENGLCVKDWRYAVRICNINTANLVAESSAADLIKLMSRAMDRLPNFNNIRPAFYVNRTVYSMLRIQALNKSANAIAIEAALDQFGTPQKMATFQGVPIRKVDQLLNTEARVV